MMRDESDWKSYREMSDDLRAICVQAIAECSDLGAEARENRNAVSEIKITNVDQSYIDFLDGQIELEPRGPEWNQILMFRRAALAEHVGRELASCVLRCGTTHYSFNVDPISGSVVHFEVYEEFYND